jgi:capsule polysaccharide modification protein KpsS
MHHYRGAAKKLIDTGNMRRLVEKLRDKYVHGKREEFQYIGGHVGRHIRMWANSVRLRRFYRPLPEHERFVYYPLHVPADVALTLRSPEYLDQYALIDFISRSVPYTHKVAIKEHPALVGAVEYSRMRDLLKRRDNVILLDSGINNYSILRASDAVLTVNSKSGAEALLLGKPVLALGDSFYRASSLVHRIDRLGDLPEKMAEILAKQKVINQEQIQSYFQNVWDRSLPGEIYDIAPDNVKWFAKSLSTFINSDQ